MLQSTRSQRVGHDGATERKMCCGSYLTQIHFLHYSSPLLLEMQAWFVFQTKVPPVDICCPPTQDLFFFPLRPHCSFPPAMDSLWKPSPHSDSAMVTMPPCLPSLPRWDPWPRPASAQDPTHPLLTGTTVWAGMRLKPALPLRLLRLCQWKAWSKKQAEGQGKEHRPEINVSRNCHAIKREGNKIGQKKKTEGEVKAGRGRDPDKGKRLLMRAELSFWT